MRRGEQNPSLRGEEQPGIYSEPHKLPLDGLAKRLRTDLEAGLTRKDAEERLQRYGANVIPKVKPSLFRIYIAPLLNWLINIYLIISTILAFLAFILPEVWTQIAQWLSIVSINAALAIFQQARAQARIEALQRLSAPKSRVIREGALMEIRSDQLVPGDVIQLRQGDRVPADARIVSARSLRVDEASLTGESRGVDKSEVDVDAESDTSISSRRNMVFMGTYVTVGSAKALVVRTGRETELGKISGRLEELNIGEIPLRQKVNEIAKYLGIAVLVLLSILLTYNMVLLYVNNKLFISGLLNTTLVARTIVRSLITAMSVMPINIPLLTTLTLLTGVLAMAKYRVVIRNPSVVESLGRVSVVCSDKTGTITKNEMTVKWICLPTRSRGPLYGVTGVGFQPEGEIVSIDSGKSLREVAGQEPEILSGGKVEINPETPLEYLLVSGMLNNESTIVETTEDSFKRQATYKAIGNTTDASILALFRKSKLNESNCRSRFEEVLDYPFESRLKRVTRVFKDNVKGQYVVFTKGATEALLPLCNSAIAERVTDQVPLGEEYRSLIAGNVDLFGSSAYRVISFAFKNLRRLPPESNISRGFFEDDLTYLGFVAITDPPREGVRESVSEAKLAGIKPVMITGDSVETAKSIARQVGITGERDPVVEGQQIEHLSEEEFSRASVFARVSPEHKMNLVDRYKKQNRVVAMTGDGVNDVLAISMADVGISMGITGTDVAKQAADMIITDDSFNSIITGVRLGRGVFQKIQSLIFFYIAVNFAEALIFFGSSLIPGFYLLNNWQQIYIFMTAHSLPPLGLIIDRLSKDVMKEKPRNMEGFSKQQKVAFFLFTVSLAIAFYIAYFGTLSGTIPFFEENTVGYIPDFSPDDFLNPINWAQAKARTMLHTVVFVAECTLVISLRRSNKPIHRILGEDNYWVVWVFVLLVPLAHLILMYVPETQVMLSSFYGMNLEVVRLTLFDWVVAIILGLAPVLLLELHKARMRELR